MRNSHVRSNETRHRKGTQRAGEFVGADMNPHVLGSDAAELQRNVLEPWRFRVGHGFAENRKPGRRIEPPKNLPALDKLASFVDRLVHCLGIGDRLGWRRAEKTAGGEDITKNCARTGSVYSGL